MGGISDSYQKFVKELPESPGVYLMRGGGGRILYVGKAGNLKRRVSSYFLRPLESRIHRLILEVKKINYKKTDTALEALILESRLIKKYKPPYNVRGKDDKSFLYVEITRDKYPRVLLVRGKDLEKGNLHYGPFTSAKSIREALRLVRRIFPYSTHPDTKVMGIGLPRVIQLPEIRRPCFEYQIGLCPGTCVGDISKRDYAKIARNIKLLFEGRKSKLLKILEEEMRAAAAREEFELAEKKKRQIFALKHIQDVALISESEDRELNVKDKMLSGRIEGYDISNISGTYAVGSMVVFVNSKPSPSEYRKFKIRTVSGSNDVGMLKEVLQRRLRHKEWPLPDLLLVDGGKPQVYVAEEVLCEFGHKIPTVGIAKGPKRKKNELVFPTSGSYTEYGSYTRAVLIRVRDEAHRFAIAYHRKFRRKF